uniref:EGF-like domain-containing protein n=1 Tax=Strongyloides venezuelensis TaxID=75913 RepID=A0A0K0F806_STRVS
MKNFYRWKVSSIVLQLLLFQLSIATNYPSNIRLVADGIKGIQEVIKNNEPSLHVAYPKEKPCGSRFILHKLQPKDKFNTSTYYEFELIRKNTDDIIVMYRYTPESTPDKYLLEFIVYFPVTMMSTLRTYLPKLLYKTTPNEHRLVSRLKMTFLTNPGNLDLKNFFNQETIIKERNIDNWDVSSQINPMTMGYELKIVPINIGEKPSVKGITNQITLFKESLPGEKISILVKALGPNERGDCKDVTDHEIIYYTMVKEVSKYKFFINYCAPWKKVMVKEYIIRKSYFFINPSSNNFYRTLGVYIIGAPKNFDLNLFPSITSYISSIWEFVGVQIKADYISIYDNVTVIAKDNMPTIYFRCRNANTFCVPVHYVDESGTMDVSEYNNKEVIFVQLTKSEFGKYKIVLHYYGPYDDIATMKVKATNAYIVVPFTNSLLERNVEMRYIKVPSTLNDSLKPQVYVVLPGTPLPELIAYHNKDIEINTLLTVDPITCIFKSKIPEERGLYTVIYEKGSVPPTKIIENSITVYITKTVSQKIVKYKFVHLSVDEKPTITANNNEVIIFVQYTKVIGLETKYNVMIYVYVPWKHIIDNGLELPEIRVISPDFNKYIISLTNIIYLVRPPSNFKHSLFILPYNQETNTYLTTYSVQFPVILQYIQKKSLPPTEALYNSITIYKPFNEKTCSVVYLNDNEKPNYQFYAGKEVIYYRVTQVRDGVYKLSFEIYAPWSKIITKEYDLTKLFIVFPKIEGIKFEQTIEYKYINCPDTFKPPSRYVIILLPSGEWPKITTTTTTTTTQKPKSKILYIFKASKQIPGTIVVPIGEEIVPKVTYIKKHVTIYVKSIPEDMECEIISYNNDTIPLVSSLSNDKITIYVAMTKIKGSLDTYFFKFFIRLPQKCLKDSCKLPKIYIIPDDYKKQIIATESLIYLEPITKRFVYIYNPYMINYVNNYDHKTSLSIVYYNNQEISIPPVKAIYKKSTIYVVYDLYQSPITFKQINNIKEINTQLYIGETVYFYTTTETSNGKILYTFYLYAPWSNVIGNKLSLKNIYMVFPSANYDPNVSIEYLECPESVPMYKRPVILISPFEGKEWPPVPLFPGKPKQIYIPGIKKPGVVIYPLYPTITVPIKSYSKKDITFYVRKNSLMVCEYEIEEFKGTGSPSIDGLHRKIYIFIKYVKLPTANEEYEVKLYIYIPWQYISKEGLELPTINVIGPDYKNVYIRQDNIFYLNPLQKVAFQKNFIYVFNPELGVYTKDYNVDTNIYLQFINMQPRAIPIDWRPTIWKPLPQQGPSQFQIVYLQPDESPNPKSYPNNEIVYYSTSKTVDGRFQYTLYYQVPFSQVSNKKYQCTNVYFVVPRTGKFSRKIKIVYLDRPNDISYNKCIVIYCPSDKIEWIYPTTTSKPTTTTTTTTTIPPPIEVIPPSYPGNGITCVSYDPIVGRPSLSIKGTIIYIPHLGTSGIEFTFKIFNGTWLPTYDKLKNRIQFFVKYLNVPDAPQFYKMILFVYVPWGVISKENKNLPQFYVHAQQNTLIFGPDSIFYLNPPNPYPPVFTFPYDQNTTNYVENYSPEVNIMIKYISSKEVPPPSSIYGRPGVYKQGRPTIFIYRSDRNAIIDVNNFSDKEVIYYSYEIMTNGKYQLILDVYVPWNSILRNNFKSETTYIYIPLQHKYFNTICQINWIQRPKGFPDHLNPIIITNGNTDKYLTYANLQPNIPIDLVVFEDNLPSMHTSTNPIIYLPDPQIISGKKILVELIHIRNQNEIKINNKNKVLIFYKYVKKNPNDEKFVIELNVYCPWKLLMDGKIDLSVIYVKIPLIKYIDPIVIEKFIEIPENLPEGKRPIIIVIGPNEKYPNLDKIASLIRLNVIQLQKDQIPFEGSRTFHPTIFIQQSDNKILSTKVIKLNANEVLKNVSNDNEITLNYRIEKNNSNEYVVKIYYSAPWDKITKRKSFIPQMYIYVPRYHMFLKTDIVIEYLGNKSEITKCFGGSDNINKTVLLSGYSYIYNKYKTFIYPGLTLNIEYIDNDLSIPNKGIENKPTIYRKKFANGTQPTVDLVKLNKGENPDTSKYNKKEIIFYRYEKTNPFIEKYKLYLYIYTNWESIISSAENGLVRYFQTMFLYIDPNDYLVTKPALIEFINVPNEIRPNKNNMCIENNPEFPLNYECQFCEKIKSIEFENLQSNDNIPKVGKNNHPTIYIRPRGYYDKRINKRELKIKEKLPSDLSDTPTIMYKFDKIPNGKNQLTIYFYAPWDKVVKKEIILPDIYVYIPISSNHYENPPIINYIGDFSLLPEEKAPEGFISIYLHSIKAYTPVIYPGLKLMLQYVKKNADVPLKAYKNHPTIYKKMNEDGSKPKIRLILFTKEIKMDIKRKENETIIYYTYSKFPQHNRKYTLKLYLEGPWKLYQDKVLEDHNIYLFIDIQDQLVKKPAIVTYLNQNKDTHEALKHCVIEDYSNENYPEGTVIDDLLKSGITKINSTVPTEGFRGLPSIYERVRGNGFKFVELKKNEEPKRSDEPIVFIKFDKVNGKEKKYDFIIFVSAPWNKVTKREILLSDLYVIVPRDHRFVNKKPIINYLGSFDKSLNGRPPKGFVSVYDHESYDFSEILYPGLKVDIGYIKAQTNPPTEYLDKYPTIYKKLAPNGNKEKFTLIKLQKNDTTNDMSKQNEKTILYKYVREKSTATKYNLEITFVDEFYDILAFKKFLQTTFIYIKTDDELVDKPATLFFYGIFGSKRKLIKKAFYENNNNTHYPYVDNPYEDKGYKLEYEIFKPTDEIPKKSNNNQPTIYIRPRTLNDVIPKIKEWNNKERPNGLGNGDQPVIYYQFSEIPNNSDSTPRYNLSIYYYAPWYKVERREIILPQIYVYIPKDHPYIESKPFITNIGDFSQLENKAPPEPCVSYYVHVKDKYSQFSYPGLSLNLLYLRKHNQLPLKNNEIIPNMYKKSYLNGTNPVVSILKLKINQEPGKQHYTDKEIVYYKYVNLKDTDRKFTLKLYIYLSYDKLINGSTYFQTAYIMINPADQVIGNTIITTFIECPFDEKIISPGIVSSDSNGMISNTPINQFDDSLHHLDVVYLPTSKDIPKSSRNKDLFITIYERPRTPINLKYHYKSHTINETTDLITTNLGNQPHIWYQFRRTMKVSKNYRDSKDIFTHTITLFVYNNWFSVGQRDIFIPDVYVYIPNENVKYEVKTNYLGSYKAMRGNKMPIGLISCFNHQTKQYPSIKYPALTISFMYLDSNKEVPTNYVDNRPTIYKRKYNNGMKPEVEVIQLEDNESPNTNKFTGKEVIFYRHKKMPKTTEIKYVLHLYIYAPFKAILQREKYFQTSYLYIDKNDDLIDKNAKIEYIGDSKNKAKFSCLLQQHQEDGYPINCKNNFGEPEYTVEVLKLKPTDNIPTTGKNKNPTIYVRPRDSKDIEFNILPISNKSTPTNRPTIYHSLVSKNLHGTTVPVFTLYYHVDWEMVKNFEITLPEVYAINGDDKYPLPPEGIFVGGDFYNDKDINGLISCFNNGKYPQITYPFLRAKNKVLENDDVIPAKEINDKPTIYFKKAKDNHNYNYKLVYLNHKEEPNTAGYRDMIVVFYKHVKIGQPTSLKYQLQVFILGPWNDIHDRKILYEVPFIYISGNNRFFLPQTQIKMLELPSNVYEEDVIPLQINRITNKYPTILCYYCIQPYILKSEVLRVKQQAPNIINDRIPRAFMERNSNAGILYDLAPLPENIDFNNHYTFGPQLYYNYVGDRNSRKRTLHIYTFTHWLPIREGSIILPTVRIFLPKDSDPINETNYRSIRTVNEVPRLPIFPFYGFVHPNNKFYNKEIILHHYEIKRGFNYPLRHSSNHHNGEVTKKYPHDYRSRVTPKRSWLRNDKDGTTTRRRFTISIERTKTTSRPIIGSQGKCRRKNPRKHKN